MNYLPPFWGYPPPRNKGGNPQHMEKTIERAVRRALQLKDHDKNMKAKKRDEKRKRSAQARGIFFFALEWYILGLVTSPLAGALWNMLVNHLTGK